MDIPHRLYNSVQDIVVVVVVVVAVTDLLGRYPPANYRYRTLRAYK